MGDWESPDPSIANHEITKSTNRQITKSAMIRIAIASERKAKVDAVRSAARSIARLGIPGWDEVELITHRTESDVAATPVDDADLMRGARSRVHNLFSQLAGEGIAADLFLGLEGGLHVEQFAGKRLVFLRGWVYACDAQASGTFGCSPSIEVPAEIAEAVLDRGEDLGDMIDRFSGRVDVRSKEGTWGVLTRDLITRGRSFEVATLAALAPYYNASIFRRDSEHIK
jgi:inosine/xanthosine triphosphatase